MMHSSTVPVDAGANEVEMQRRMPHLLAQLLRPTAAEVVAQSEVVIAAQSAPPLRTLARWRGRTSGLSM